MSTLNKRILLYFGIFVMYIIKFQIKSNAMPKSEFTSDKLV